MHVRPRECSGWRARAGPLQFKPGMPRAQVLIVPRLGSPGHLPVGGNSGLMYCRASTPAAAARHGVGACLPSVASPAHCRGTVRLALGSPLVPLCSRSSVANPEELGCLWGGPASSGASVALAWEPPTRPPSPWLPLQPVRPRTRASKQAVVFSQGQRCRSTIKLRGPRCRGSRAGPLQPPVAPGAPWPVAAPQLCSAWGTVSPVRLGLHFLSQRTPAAGLGPHPTLLQCGLVYDPWSQGRVEPHCGMFCCPCLE